MTRAVHHPGSFESTAAAPTYTDAANTGAFFDYDGSAFAQFGAKGTGSIGVKIRTLNSGAPLTALTFVANADATFAGNVNMSSGKTFAAQAITATTIATASAITITNSTGSALLQINGGSGVSKPAYILVNGTDAGSVSRNWYFGVNPFASDGSFEVRDGGGGVGFKTTPGGVTSFGAGASGIGSIATGSISVQNDIGMTHTNGIVIGSVRVVVFTSGGTSLTATGAIIAGGQIASAVGAAVAFGGTNTAAGSEVYQAWNQAAAGNNVFMTLYTDGGGGILRGTIDFNRGGGLVRYNTTSDYRAKTLYGTYADSGSAIDGVPVYVGLMNGATEKRPMFVAHEMQAFAPWAVSGRKDGKAMQQLDHTSLVPILWAEVQSLRSRVRQLEQRAA